MRLFRIVKRCIDEWDPVALLVIGCPIDEYDPESSMITDIITEKSTTEEICAAVSGVFSKMFDKYGYPAKYCMDVSQKIHDAINGKYAPSIITEQFDTPFGYLEVLRNGKRMPFEIYKSKYQSENINGEDVSAEGCYDIFIDYEGMKKGDEICV